MSILSLLKKKEYLFAVDIGSTGIKVIELDLAHSKPKLTTHVIGGLAGEIFSSNSITQGQKVADRLSGLLDGIELGDKRAVVGIPAPAVFTKRIKIPAVAPKDLRDHISLEAGNFIPHNINAVKLDYHVVGEAEKNQIEVLVVAAKNETVDSFSDALGLAGINVGIVDIDLFALQNMFEINYPEYIDQNVALINIGARYSAVNICSKGETLFTGDISIGGRSITESLAEQLGVSFDEAEKLKLSGSSDAKSALALPVELAAGEINRQLSFFWNATGSEEGIDLVGLVGGGALTPGLRAAIAERTGIETIVLDPYKEISLDGSDHGANKDTHPALFGIAVGLALRSFGDRTDLAKLR